MNVIIYKPDIATFLKEVPKDEPIYRMSYSKVSGQFPTYALEICLSSFNEEDRVIAWIAEIGNCPAGNKDDISDLLDKAEVYEVGIAKMLGARKTLEGIISIDVKKGSLPELPEDKPTKT